MDVELTQIRYEVADGVATVTLDRPDHRNAFSGTMAGELVHAAGAADADAGVRVVLVTGAGRDFCVGADLSGGPDTFSRNRLDDRPSGPLSETIGGAPRDRGGVASLAFAALRKPVIAAINGTAVGIGATMTLPMDIRLAAASARFGFPFVRRGILPEAASRWFLPRVVGISQAMEWVATGRVFDADEALRGRLVSRVVPDDELLPAARALAADIVLLALGLAPDRVAGAHGAGLGPGRRRGRDLVPREAAAAVQRAGGRRPAPLAGAAAGRGRSAADGRFRLVGGERDVPAASATRPSSRTPVPANSSAPVPRHSITGAAAAVANAHWHATGLRIRTGRSRPADTSANSV